MDRAPDEEAVIVLAPSFAAARFPKDDLIAEHGHLMLAPLLHGDRLPGEIAMSAQTRTTSTPPKFVKSASCVQTSDPWTSAVAAIQVSCTRGFRPAASSPAAKRA